MHLEELRQAEEDWSGLRDAQERRRLQNRLNARASRRRRARSSQPLAAAQAKTAELRWVFENSKPQTLSRYESTGPVNRDQLQLSPLIRLLHRVYGLKTELGYNASRAYASATFPLSSDHLMPLLQYNLKRAVMTNWAILSVCSASSSPDWIHKVCNSLAPELVLFPSDPRQQGTIEMPPALVPTEVQNQVPHLPWIDILPFPSMRDHVIRMVAGSDVSGFDAEDLRSDLAGIGEPIPVGPDRSEVPCIIVWDAPWSPSGFEVTQAFVRKWGSLLVGCQELIKATNKWRSLRGEKPLAVVRRG